jgi:ABC-type lipoprotein release transport system permease subunit
MALGAMPAGIWRMVLHEGLRVTVRGVIVGLILGAGMAALARPILIGVSATDPLTFGGVTVTVLTVALLSIVGPAWRAMRTDPARTLRGE